MTAVAMPRRAVLGLLLLLVLPVAARSRSPWWQHVKEARAAYRAKADRRSQSLYLQALTELEATPHLLGSAEAHSLAGLLPDLQRPFTRAYRDAPLAKLERERQDPVYHREALDRIGRVVEIQRRLLGPNHKATLDSLKHLRFMKKLYADLDRHR